MTETILIDKTNVHDVILAAERITVQLRESTSSHPKAAQVAISLDAIASMAEDATRLFELITNLYSAALPAPNSSESKCAVTFDQKIPITSAIFQSSPRNVRGLAILANYLGEELHLPVEQATICQLIDDCEGGSGSGALYLTSMKSKNWVSKAAKGSTYFVLTDEAKETIHNMREKALPELRAECEAPVIPFGPATAEYFDIKKADMALIVLANHLKDSLSSTFSSSDLQSLFRTYCRTPDVSAYIVSALRDKGLVRSVPQSGIYSLTERAQWRIAKLRAVATP